MMRIDAKVVRLTPAQEKARQEELAKRMADKQFRLKALRFEQFLKLRAEFDDLPPEEAEKLFTRSQLEEQAKKGMGLINAFALTKKEIARAAHAFITFVRKLMPWNWTKRFAIRTGLAAALIWGGALSAECVDKDGNVKWRDELNVNGITTVGLNHGLDVVFHASTQVSPWYVGLIQGSSTPTFSAADTMSSHAGWTEYTAYSQTNRVTWDEGAAAAGVTTNSVTMDYSMNASGTVAGGFLTSSSTKSGTSGTLWMTATFSGGNQSVGNGDTLKLTYTLSTSSS